MLSHVQLYTERVRFGTNSISTVQMFVSAFFWIATRAEKSDVQTQFLPHNWSYNFFFIYGALFPMRHIQKARANSANSHPNLSAFEKRLNEKECNIKWNGMDALQSTYVCRQCRHTRAGYYAIFTCSFNCLENGLELLFDVNLKQL